nr:DUF4113 domain-containing protein [Providencia rettgeri]
MKLKQPTKGCFWFKYQMKREMLSPAYTTNFDELPVVKC